MSEIKAGRQIEKPLYTIKGLKERAGRETEKERIRKIEEARKTVINEIAQAETMAPTTIGPVIDVAAPSAQRQRQIERVLSSGLDDVYINLAPDKQTQFKLAGEKTADKINKILSKTKINLGAIVKLIKKWLSLIPGINKYFLEQEAKIKADEIVKIKRGSVKT